MADKHLSVSVTNDQDDEVIPSAVNSPSADSCFSPALHSIDEQVRSPGYASESSTAASVVAHDDSSPPPPPPPLRVPPATPPTTPSAGVTREDSSSSDSHHGHSKAKKFHLHQHQEQHGQHSHHGHGHSHSHQHHHHSVIHIPKSIRKGAQHLYHNLSNQLPSRGNISVPINPTGSDNGGSGNGNTSPNGRPGMPGMMKTFSFVAKHGGVSVQNSSMVDVEHDDEFFRDLMTSEVLDIPEVDSTPVPELTTIEKIIQWFQEVTSLSEEGRETVRSVLDTLTIGLFMTLCTIVALFVTDINGMIGTRNSDDPVSNIMFALFLIFIAELTLESLVRPRYFWSMFFWLDVLAIGSMVNDIPTAAGFIGLPRSTITARAGRVGRIVRIVRIVRLTRIGKLAKYPARIYGYLFPATVASANAKARARPHHQNSEHGGEPNSGSGSGKYAPLSSSSSPSPTSFSKGGHSNKESALSVGAGGTHSNSNSPAPGALGSGTGGGDNSGNSGSNTDVDNSHVDSGDKEIELTVAATAAAAAAATAAGRRSNSASPNNNNTNIKDTGSVTVGTNEGSRFDDEEEEDVVLEEDAGTLLSEMTQITISKIIAGIVIMLLALNYIGKLEIAYTPVIAVEDKLEVINEYFDTINVSLPVSFVDTQLNTLRLLNLDLIKDYSECYYFAYLNKSKYEWTGQVEYIVLKDTTVHDVINDKSVRITNEVDLHFLTYPSGTSILKDAEYDYSLVIPGSGSNNNYSTWFQVDNGMNYPISYTDDMIRLDANVISPAVFIVKLNMHADSVATAYGSLQVSLFMIGLILLWYVIYNAQAQALSDKICKPMEEMMVDMTSASMLEFSDMKSIYLVKPENDDEEDKIALLHEVEILETDDEETQLAKRKANSIVRYKKRMYQEHKEAIAQKEMLKIEAQREESLYEIKQINKTFQNMASGLLAFSKYVPRDIVLEMLRGGTNTGLGVKPKEITIFFSDIEGFTTICDMMTPNDVLFMLSKYFKVMSNIISKLGGTLLEFIGDAILATWNAPGNVADHASGCIEASLQMQEALVSMCGNEDDDPADMTPEDSCYYWRVVRKYPVIKIRCGVHSGRVFVGNLGAPNRMKFGIMGDGVNLASRLEELNKKYATRIIISQNTYEMGATNCRAAADDLSGNYIASQYITRQLDLVQVKGRSSGTAVYEVVGRRMPLPFLSNGDVENSYIDNAVDCSWTPVIRSEHTTQFGVTNNKENAPILSHLHKFTHKYNTAIAAYFRRDFETAITLFLEVMELKKELCEIQAKVRKYKKLVRARIQSGQPAHGNDVSMIGVSVLDQVSIDKLSEVEYSEDLPSQLLIERCREFLVHPPPNDWNGVEILKGKDG